MPNGIDVFSLAVTALAASSATAFYLLRIHRMLFPDKLKIVGYWKFRNEAKVMVYWADVRVPKGGMTAKKCKVSLSLKGAFIPSGFGFPGFTLQGTDINASTQVYLFDIFQEELVFLPEPDGTRHDFSLDDVKNETLHINVRSDNIRGIDMTEKISSILDKAKLYSVKGLTSMIFQV